MVNNVEETDILRKARECFGRRAWKGSYESFLDADAASPLEVGDLERLAVAAYLVGKDDEFLRILDRAHHAHLNHDSHVEAARCAFWIGLLLLLRGEVGPATGWLARSQRLLEDFDCVERGYLFLPAAEQELSEGDAEAAYRTASKAVALGDVHHEWDLVALGRHLQGRALLDQGEMSGGLGLLDEVMVAATAGELSPIVTGLIYCSVIEACEGAYALGRAREWTDALARWCDEQPEMVAFTATCLVHRAEIMRRHGAWPSAIQEARRASTRRAEGNERKPPAAAFYEQAEVHRLRGEFEAAEAAYGEASRGGLEPQPGLALLRLAQGRTDVAQAAIRRVVATAADRSRRAKILPAYIEIMIAVGDIEAAHEACREMESIAETFDTGALGAIAAQARGSIDLAEGGAQEALISLRRAGQVWQRLEMPYETARVRMLIGMACQKLGDEDGCRLELEAAKSAFAELGAAADLARVQDLEQVPTRRQTHGLTTREMEVLSLVATGKTNRSIASALFVSEKTVDRHVSNIFAKLNVSSRAAATAYAYENKLI